MQTQQRSESDLQDEINLGDLLAILVQRIWLMAAVFVVVLAGGLAYAILAKPIYQADALIQVEDQKAGALGGLSQLTETLGIQQSSVAGELEILRSREVLMKAIAATQADIQVQVDTLFPVVGAWIARRNEASDSGVAEPLWGLSSYSWGGEHLVFAEVDLPRRQLGRSLYLEVTDAGYTVFDADDKPLADGVVGQRTLFKIGGEDATVAVKSLTGRPGTRFSFIQQSPIQAFENVRKALSVSEAGNQSNIIRIAFKHPDHEFATQLLNAVADAYLAQNVERRSAEARSSLTFLDQQLPELRRQVTEAEHALSQYRSVSSTIAIDKEAEGLLQQATKLENNRLELRMKRDEMLQRFKPEHPQIRALGQQLNAIDAAVAELNKSIDQLPEAQRDLLPFERDVRVSNALYTSLLNNAQQLRVAEAGAIGNVRIIDYAVQNERPVEPRRAMLVAVAGMLGAMLSLLAAFLAHFLRPAVQRPEQIEQATGLNTYVVVPQSPNQRRLLRTKRLADAQPVEQKVLAAAWPEDPAVESLRSLRTGLTFAMMGSPGNTIVMTGATSGVGKSFVSSNFAALLASGGQRVLLIDTDMRRPRLHEYFAHDKKARGLSDILAGTADLEDVIRADVLPGLSILPAGTIPPNPGELLLSIRFNELLTTVQQNYDLVVLDTPPILPVADVLAIMQHATVAFIVARSEQSTVSELRDAMTKLHHAGVAKPVKGMVFNGMRRRRIGYGASYNYYYSYK